MSRACLLILSILLYAIPGLGADRNLDENERLITLLQTNDIHGGLEPSYAKDGTPVGGMSLFSGIVHAIRKGLSNEYGDRAGLLLLDAGDQFQGTLLSNYNEGQLVFAAMNLTGYDAAVPGNHDYDFGPMGWLDDQVTPQTTDQNPRGALMRLVAQAQFPLLAANVYFRGSIVNPLGQSVVVDGSYCRSMTDAIDWSRARRVDYAIPYVVKTVAGVRVALIGMDHPETPVLTTAANVSDLCFRDSYETYREVRAELEGKADIFVLMIHDGNTRSNFEVSKLVARITAFTEGPHRLDAVIAGHTHEVNEEIVNGVPIVQSASGGVMFGRIDLVWNAQARTLNSARSRIFAGVPMPWGHCDPKAESFCRETGFGMDYEGVSADPDPRIQSMIGSERQRIAPLAAEHLGATEAVLYPQRIDESPLADALSDGLRELSGADIAILNTGGLRAPLPAGNFTYEDLFRVVPFNNHAVVMDQVSATQLVKAFEHSAQSCGRFGILVESGLKGVFSRDCTPDRDVDPDARLVHLETLSGEVILDVAKGIEPAPDKFFRVATLDFLATGGSGYSEFEGQSVSQDLGIFREILASYLLNHPGKFAAQTDERWKNAQSSSL